MLVLVLMDLNRWLAGRGSNRSWAGWGESCEMRLALPNRRCWYNDSRLGRTLSIILEAASIYNSINAELFLHPFIMKDPNHMHTVTWNVRTILIAASSKDSMICEVKPNDLNLLRKNSRCWAFLTIVSTFSSPLRPLQIVEPRYLHKFSSTRRNNELRHGIVSLAYVHWLFFREMEPQSIERNKIGIHDRYSDNSNCIILRTLFY